MAEAMRIAEALLFAAAEPLDEKDIEKRMPRGITDSSGTTCWSAAFRSISRSGVAPVPTSAAKKLR